jgi:outer membrane protein
MKKLLSSITILCFATSAFTSTSYAENVADDYDSNYYQEEGSILFKVRGSGVFSKGKLGGLPAPTSTKGKASPAKIGNFISNGYGVEGSTTVFFSKNIAGELGLGLMNYKTSASAISGVGYNYSNNPTMSKRKDIYAVPMVLTLQYHVAPYGAIRPYVGAGYQYTYMLSKSQQFIMNSAHGYVLQGGVDFALTDDTVISLDVKRYQLTPKVTFKPAFLGRSLSSNAKINPIIVSVGLGWKF